MSGFKDDVLSILRDNLMLHGETVGWVLSEDVELVTELEKRKLLLIKTKFPKRVFLIDYVVLAKEYISVSFLLRAFSLLSKMGIIILDVSNWNSKLVDEYISVFGNFVGTPLNYGNRQYIVIHAGADYGN